MSWKFLRPSWRARSLTIIGGLMWMIFCALSASAESGAASGEASAAGGATGAGAGAGETGPIGASVFSRMREIGGRTERLAVPSLSARFARGFFSSISESVSIAGFGAGLGASAAFCGGSEEGRALAAGAAVGRFDSGAALTGAAFAEEATFAGGLLARAGLRGAVLVFGLVGISVPEKNVTIRSCLGADWFTARRGSPDEWLRGFPALSPHPRRESRPDPRPLRPAILRDS